MGEKKNGECCDCFGRRCDSTAIILQKEMFTLCLCVFTMSKRGSQFRHRGGSRKMEKLFFTKTSLLLILVVFRYAVAYNDGGGLEGTGRSGRG